MIVAIRALALRRLHGERSSDAYQPFAHTDHPKTAALATSFENRNIEPLSVILYGDSEALFIAIEDDPDIPSFCADCP